MLGTGIFAFHSSPLSFLMHEWLLWIRSACGVTRSMWPCS